MKRITEILLSQQVMGIAVGSIITGVFLVLNNYVNRPVKTEQKAVQKVINNYYYFNSQKDESVIQLSQQN